MKLDRYLPILRWGRHYQRQQAMHDGIAAVIVTFMLVPQALAYAVLAGLPAQVGLYASMLPLVVYAVLGSSSTLAVGPVAVAALMTATAIAPFAAQSAALGMQAAVILAAISGVFLSVAGVLRLGFFANFLSYPVIAGFMTAASLLIASSQVPVLLGIAATGDNLWQLWQGIFKHAGQWHAATATLSVLAIILLTLTRRFGRTMFERMGWHAYWAAMFSRAVPALLVMVSIVLMRLQLPSLEGVKVLGNIPAGLPTLSLPSLDAGLWQALWMPALLISIVGYVESISVAQNLAMKRRERLDPDQELLALGCANLAAALSHGQPVTGGVARSVVNMDAGAQTPAAGLFTAIGMGLATLLLTGWLSDLPRYMLAATIVVAVLSVIDLKVFAATWQRSRSDFVALMLTVLITLFVNVESGISAGVGLSIAMHLYRSSRPHIAIVGQVPGTQHFRNVDRHAVDVCPDVVTLRVDESLFFANARYLEQKVLEIVANQAGIKHLVLMCSAVNAIDSSAMEVLQEINGYLSRLNIGFHFSEVKGPVMDKLQHTPLAQQLNGHIYLTQYQAYEALSCVASSGA